MKKLNGKGYIWHYFWKGAVSVLTGTMSGCKDFIPETAKGVMVK